MLGPWLNRPGRRPLEGSPAHYRDDDHDQDGQHDEPADEQPHRVTLPANVLATALWAASQACSLAPAVHKP